MPSEAKRAELYLLLLQSITALVMALINATPSCRYDVQLTIKKRLFQLVKTLWSYLKDEAAELETLVDSDANSRALESSRGFNELISEHHADSRALDSSRGFTNLSLEYEKSPNVEHFHHASLNSTLASGAADPMHGSRFPLIHRLLTVLARTPNDEIFTQTVQPFLHEPDFHQHLQDEMAVFRRMLAGEEPSLYQAEKVLVKRLNRMEIAMQRIMEQLEALAESG
ncbi:uncharacterized protein LOC134214298 [Armigeres subalbatus]|uniref:uncharacterized protein LOC134214296 n=1 Tax=Armigeres subalbatus TaxID=124917 RepID=UPI002ED0DB9B